MQLTLVEHLLGSNVAGMDKAIYIYIILVN